MREVLEYSPADGSWSENSSKYGAVKRFLRSSGLLEDAAPENQLSNSDSTSTPYPFDAHSAWAIAHKLPLERTLDPETADYQIQMPYINTAAGSNFWDTRSKEEIIKVLGKPSFRDEAAKAQDARAKKLITAMWWLDFNNTEINTSNPFNDPVIEQFGMYVPDDDALDANGADLGWEGGAVSILNFGPELGNQQLRGLVDAIGLFAQCTRGDSLRRVPNVVIHDNFAPRHFTHTNTTETPAGLARFGRPYIEISNMSLRKGDREWATTVPVHEIFHQLDPYGYFSSRFAYKDVDGDGNNDHAITLCGGRCVGQHTCGALVVHKDAYALTTPHEDGASASEATLRGETLDQHRRDACIDHLNLIMSGSMPIVCDPDPGIWRVERNTGFDIIMPRIADGLILDPIKLYFTDKVSREVTATRHGSAHALLF